MKKHAYLIMAHNEPELLKKILKEIDDPRNDIYIHIDKKSKDLDPRKFENAVNMSKIYFVPGMSIYWGTISMVKCELRLLDAAVKRKYHYYHLISGADFPLKSQDYIHAFLDDEDSEFISYHKDGEPGYDFLKKIRLYYPLMRYVGKGVFEGNTIHDKIGRKLGYWQLRFTEIQEDHHVDRTRRYKDLVFYKGDQWFTITHDFAQYVLSRKREILWTYFLTDGADEIFLSTLAMNSGFACKVKNTSLREIDWKRGEPYEYTKDDLDMLKSSNALFARKISYDNSPELVEGLINHLHPTV
ncbi:MAG: beta-1,6-N-acetylglucosaminyltransferase [Lachnospiraceae bacterium]|nr:beta-1,6-N-acetylglucosaminyltransferase [Lachnospiraceae bacterium]